MADYLKIPEVARRLDVSEPTVRRMVKGGKLPSVFVGGAYRVSEADLAEYLENARVKPGKAQASPSSEPSFNDALEEERRRAELEEIRERYRATREGLSHYCDLWDRRIASNDLERESVRGFLEAAGALLPAAIESVISELVEIDSVVGRAEDDSVSDEALAEASVKPVLDRYHAIGRRLQAEWWERFADTEPAEDTADNNTVANFLDFKEAKLRATLNKRAASE